MRIDAAQFNIGEVELYARLGSLIPADLRILSAMDVLCTDKTGTLTQDHVVLERYVDVTNRSSEDVLRYAYMNSFYQTGLRNLLLDWVSEVLGEAGPEAVARMIKLEVKQAQTIAVPGSPA